MTVIARIRAREHMKGEGFALGAPVRGPSLGGALKAAQQPRPAIADQTGAKRQAKSDENSRTQFMATLIEALSIDAQSYFEITTGPAFAAAVAASEAFARARQSNQLLDQELTERDEQARVSFEKAYAQLELSVKGDDWKRQMLRDAYQEVAFFC